MKNAIGLCAIALLIAAGANAMPLTYLVNVTFGDGGTAIGSFTFDPLAGTPCNTGASPCGRFYNVNIVTTTGTVRTGVTYHFVCGQDVPTCTGVSPDSTQVLTLTSAAGNQAGLPALALFFTGVGAVPPAGLTNPGLLPIDLSNSSLSVGAVLEGTCIDAACSAPTPPTRTSVAGQAILENLSATWWYWYVL
jgi:hypothetical protein